MDSAKRDGEPASRRGPAPPAAGRAVLAAAGGAARNPLAWALGLGAAAAWVIGGTMTSRASVPWTAAWPYLLIAALTPVFAALAAGAAYLVLRPRRRRLPVWRNRRRSFFFDWAVIWAAWAPVWLAGWPGFWCYDANTAFRQAQAGSLTTAMPPLHTYLATGLQAWVAGWTGSNNHGIAAFIALQSAAVAGVFAYALRRLRAWGAPRAVRWGSLAYFALFPTIALFSLNWARNTAFAAALLALATCLVDALKQPGRRRLWWWVGLLAVVAVALRRDAVYALILFTVLAVAFYRPAGQADHARKARKALAVTLISASVAGGLLDPVLYRGVMGLAEGSRIATYSLPLQQLARVYTRSPDSLSGEQIAQLESFADPAALSQYRPQLADPVMVGADERRIEQDTRAFAKLWLSVGLSHPAEYLDAAVAGTVQGWLPGAVIDAYAPPGMTSYFCYEAQIPGQDSPKGPPFVRDLYADFSFGSRTPFETPVIGLLWSPGTYLWLCVFVLAAAWPGARRGPRPGRASAAWPVALLLLASCAPVFLGPTMLVRYFLPLFYCLPLLAAFLADPRVYDLAAPARPPGYQSKAIRRAGDQKPPLP